MKIVYIIGNGFDINLGLKTRYCNFYDYYKAVTTDIEKVKFLKEAISKEFKTWSDLEIGLGEYTSKLTTLQEFDEIYEDIRDELAKYIEQQETSFDFSQIDGEKIRMDFCFPEKDLPLSDRQSIEAYKNKWEKQHWEVRIITLNYTRSLEKIVQPENSLLGIHDSYQVQLKCIEHLHGFHDERMILGVNDISQITNETFRDNLDIIETFVKPKSNLASKYTVETKCENYINHADLICIFGASIGDTDKIWWELIGEQVKEGKRLIIFVKSEEIHRRMPYKANRHEREIKEYFLSKTNLTQSEKSIASSYIFVGQNTSLFSP
jgi:hypothetical protein